MGYLSPTLAVRNMKETIEFYRDSLGFKVGMVSFMLMLQNRGRKTAESAAKDYMAKMPAWSGKV